MSTFCNVLLLWFTSSLVLAFPAGALMKRSSVPIPVRALEPARVGANR